MQTKFLLLVSFVCLSLLACGGNGSSGAASEASTSSSQSDDVGLYGPGLGEADVLRSLTIKVSGGVNAEVSGKKGDGKTSLGGECDPSMFANLSFNIGTTMGDRMGVAFVSEDPIATEQTGEIALDWVLLDSAKIKASDIDLKRFKSDDGTLTITTHNASAGNRRMTGMFVAKNLEPLDGLDSPPVDVEVHFDSEFSCGVK